MLRPPTFQQMAASSGARRNYTYTFKVDGAKLTGQDALESRFPGRRQLQPDDRSWSPPPGADIDFELPQNVIPERTKDPQAPKLAAALGGVVVTHDVRRMPGLCRNSWSTRSVRV
jgi:hypothetical protein